MDTSRGGGEPPREMMSESHWPKLFTRHSVTARKAYKHTSTATWPIGNCMVWYIERYLFSILQVYAGKDCSARLPESGFRLFDGEAELFVNSPRRTNSRERSERAHNDVSFRQLVSCRELGPTPSITIFASSAATRNAPSPPRPPATWSVHYVSLYVR